MSAHNARIPFMKTTAAALALLAGMAALTPTTAFASKESMAAVADPSRPEADTKRDADRKPAEVVDFAGIKPGQTVADTLPGGGYFTRIFAKTVGPKGHVYAMVPAALSTMNAKAADGVKAIAADPGYSNVTVVDSLKLDKPVDVVWTSLNYHDLHNKAFGGDIAGFNKSVFAALKSGGTYIVIDHAAKAGSGTADTESLHRIDPAAVKAEVEAAGFKFDGESKVLAHEADDHTAKVFEAGVRGKTDQFVMKFKKP